MNELYWISVVGKLHIAFGVSIGLSLLFLAFVILGKGEDSIENYNPSCRMCNFYKGMSTVEQFRRRLQKELDYKRTFATRLALKFGILTEKGWDGKFYFEKL